MKERNFHPKGDLGLEKLNIRCSNISTNREGILLRLPLYPIEY